MTDERLVMCQTCQGNGEVVTDWERYKHPHPGDVGDEAVTECPNCDGTGEVGEIDTMSASDLPELIHCPFCRASARHVQHSAGMPGTRGYDRWCGVKCAGCGASVGSDRLFRTPAAAAAAWNARAVPAGWKLVPVEPTEEMVAAAYEDDRAYTQRNFGDVMTVQQGPYEHYVAMLASAPTPGEKT